ncbi:MAG: helix-turn-helix transcriptional regulator [Amphiplicatus sp.]
MKPTDPVRSGARQAPDASSRATEKALGATLQQLRQSRGLNQTELGRRLGVSLQQVQKYESGRDRMAASTAYRAAEILGVEVGALYAGLRNRSARSRGSSKTPRNPILVVPLTVSTRTPPARETELIDLIRSYQAIANAPDRTLVRKLLKRLSASTGRTRTASP